MSAEEATATLRMVLDDLGQVTSDLLSHHFLGAFGGLEDCIANIETAIEELAGATDARNGTSEGAEAAIRASQVPSHQPAPEKAQIGAQR
jgi:hypothetical protein